MMGDHKTEAGIVLTGCGWVTTFASGGIDQVLDARSATHQGALTDPTASPASFRSVPTHLFEDSQGLSREVKADRGAWLSGTALTHACRDASLDLAALTQSRVGLVLGCGLAGQGAMISFAGEVREQTPRFASPLHFPQTVGNYPAGALARGFKLMGPNITLAGEVTSGLRAILEACSQLRQGRADVMFAGGIEWLSETAAEAFGDEGLSMSEGACLFAIELESHAVVRGAPVLASVVRYSYSCEGMDAGNADVVSTAGRRRPGCVLIESSIGRCMGAAGAAAVAAGIGAAKGHKVPVADAGDPSRIAVCKVAPLPKACESGARRVMCLAGTHDDAMVQLELDVAKPSSA